MCGKETAGIDVADADLYQGAPWILTRSARTDESAYAKCVQLAQTVGAITRDIPVAQHDALLAFASHLPYVLSTAMVYSTDHFALSHPEVWNVMAGGYRDTSRVAASDVTMWLDILLTNQAAVVAAIRDVQFTLDQFAVLIERRDSAGLQALMQRAAAARNAKYA
jgi:prephenate dehydrogenase